MFDNYSVFPLVCLLKGEDKCLWNYVIKTWLVFTT